MKRIVPWTVAAWLGLGLGFGATARADLWTNVAGHVVTAKLAAIEGEQVLLQDTNGRIRRMPLTSLNPADQRRARAQTATEPLPVGLKIPFERAQEDILRATQFLQGGRITREQYTARCQTIKQRFEHLGLQALQRDVEPANTAVLEKLMRRLGQAEQDAEATAAPLEKPAGG